MKGLKVVLVVIGVACLLSAPGLVVPWSTLVGWAELMGLEMPPGHPVILYGLRLTCLSWALIGVFFLVVASDPVRYRPMLVLAVFGCFATAAVALVAGGLTQMQPLWYLGDAVSSGVAGVVILAFWPRGVETSAAA